MNMYVNTLKSRRSQISKSLSYQWRERARIELTHPAPPDAHGFEDQEGHQHPIRPHKSNTFKTLLFAHRKYKSGDYRIQVERKSASSQYIPYAIKPSYSPYFRMCCRNVPSYIIPIFCMTRTMTNFWSLQVFINPSYWWEFKLSLQSLRSRLEPIYLTPLQLK